MGPNLRDPTPKKTGYSGMSLVQSARDRYFLYGPNVVCTKKCDSLWIFSLQYADLYDRIDVARLTLTVPSIWGLVPWIFSNIYCAKSQIQCSRYI